MSVTRISTDQGDRGYRADWMRFRVYLDGIEQMDCITADAAKGFCLCVRKPGEGDIPLTSPTTYVEERRGKVSIVEIEASS